MSAMTKVDFKKELPCYKAKLNKFDIIEVPDMAYLMIDGHGDPNGGEFTHAIEALYPLAYKLKFASKTDLQRDYVVPPLEALWWADDMNAYTEARDKSKWSWTAMLMTPDWITNEMLDGAKSVVAPDADAPNSVTVNKVRLETLSEGLCVQVLHVGSYDEEGPVLERMHSEFIPENNLQMTKQHHEIYLSDARKTEPAKLRTILRQPVATNG